MELNKLIYVLCTLLPTGAFAADVSTQNWDGFYIGAKAGYASGDANLRVLDADPSRYPDFDGGELIKNINLNSGLVGAEIGYNFQHENWVYGIFGSTNVLNADDTKWSKDACCGTGDDKIKTKLTNISIIGARLGYTIDKVLLYVGAGAAYGRVNVNVKDANVHDDGTTSNSLTGKGSAHEWVKGYAFNAGADYALNSSWKLGLDYTYVEFNHKTFDASGESYGFVGEPQGKAVYTFSSKGLDSQMLAVTLKYTF